MKAIADRNRLCCRVVLLLPRIPTLVRKNSRTAMASAFSAALFQLGGLRIRRSRACCLVDAFASSGVGLRPVRPRDSIAPAALPRCFVRLLRFVWAMVELRG